MDVEVEPFEEQDVLAYISSRRRGTAGGPNGLGYDTLKELLSSARTRGTSADAPNSAVRDITSIVNAIVMGRIVGCEDVIDTLTWGRGTALRKSATDLARLAHI